MVDNEGNYIDFVHTNEYEITDYKYKFEDTEGVSEMVHYLGVLADRNLAPWTDDVRENLKRVELNIEVKGGLTGANLSFKGGSYATRVNNIGGFLKVDANYNFNTITLMNFWTPDFSVNFNVELKLEKNDKIKAMGAINLGRVNAGYDSNGVLKFGVGFGTKMSFNTRGGITANVPIWEFETGTIKTSN